MTMSNDQFAIALEHKRIALLKRGDDVRWDVIDSVNIEGHDESEINSIFAPYAQKWRSHGKKISVCLPSDVVDFEVLDEPLSNAELANKISHHPADSHIIVSNPKPHFTYAIFEIEHIALVRNFLSKFGYEPRAIGYCEVDQVICAPTFFDVKKFPKVAIPEEQTQQFELDLDTEAKTEPVVAAKIGISETPNIDAKKFKVEPRKAVGIFLALCIVITTIWFAISQLSENAIPPVEPDQAEANIDVPVVALDFEITARPSDHQTYSEKLEQDLVPLFVKNPEFTMLVRPEGHDLYVENFPQSALEAISATDPSGTPIPRPTQADQPSSEFGLNLIGISGAAGNPGALVQIGDGSFKRISTGDVVDGWKVDAISKKEVIISRAGESETLTVPVE